MISRRDLIKSAAVGITSLGAASLVFPKSKKKEVPAGEPKLCAYFNGEYLGEVEAYSITTYNDWYYSDSNLKHRPTKFLGSHTYGEITFSPEPFKPMYIVPFLPSKGTLLLQGQMLMKDGKTQSVKIEYKEAEITSVVLEGPNIDGIIKSINFVK